MHSVETRRKAAHVAAMKRLVKVLGFEHQILVNNILIDNPEMPERHAEREAAKQLREKVPNRFRELYDQEKMRRGLPPSRDRIELAKKVVDLYDNGHGMAYRQIADELQVGQDFITEALRDAGIVPRIGRRRKTDG